MSLYNEIFPTNPIHGFEEMQSKFDSIFIRFKSSDYREFLLIEKLEFDYSSETIDSVAAPILINFGHTGSSNAFETTGNGFISLDSESYDKSVWITSLSSFGDTTIPVIHRYDVDAHKIEQKYPNTSDFTQLTNYSPISSQKSHTFFDGSNLNVLFATISGDMSILNIMEFNIRDNGVILNNYVSLSSEYDPSLTYLGLGEDNVSIKYGPYQGRQRYK